MRICSRTPCWMALIFLVGMPAVIRGQRIPRNATPIPLLAAPPPLPCRILSPVDPSQWVNRSIPADFPIQVRWLALLALQPAYLAGRSLGSPNLVPHTRICRGREPARPSARPPVRPSARLPARPPVRPPWCTRPSRAAPPHTQKTTPGAGGRGQCDGDRGRGHLPTHPAGLPEQLQVLEAALGLVPPGGKLSSCLSCATHWGGSCPGMCHPRGGSAEGGAAARAAGVPPGVFVVGRERVWRDGPHPLLPDDVLALLAMLLVLLCIVIN